MNVTFDNYAFEIQNGANGPRLMCITSKKKLKGVVNPENTAQYIVEATEHTFFPKVLYDVSSVHNVQNSPYENDEQAAEDERREYYYMIFKNIIADILSSIGGLQFLQSLARYIENDKVTVYLNRAIGESLIGK